MPSQRNEKVISGNNQNLKKTQDKTKMARTVNAAQCHSLLSGHYECHRLMFSIVGNVNIYKEVRAKL